ncbi:MAG: hypothetical protein H7832_14060 [Magnetococcus sp. DMHC-6]
MQEFNLQELYYTMFVYLRGMWRHRWHMVLVAWFVCLSGWVGVYLMEDQYVATAKVLIEDPRTQLAEYFKKDKSGKDSFDLIDVTRQARVILNDLRSRENLLKVIRQTNIAMDIHDETEMQMALERVQMQLSVSPESKDSNVYVITHHHTDAHITQQVVEAVLNLLPQGNLQEINATQARTAQAFLNEQLEEYMARVIEAESKLRIFKANNVDLLPGEDGGYYQRVSKLTAALEKETFDLRQLEEKRGELQRQMNEIAGKTESPVKDLDDKIVEIQGQIKDLLSKYYVKGGQRMPLYTEGHMEVISLRKSIEGLESEKKDRINRLQTKIDAKDDWELEANPVFRQLRITVSEVELEMTSLRTRIEEDKRKLMELKKLEASLPAAENELLRMEQNLEMTKSKVKSMMEREGFARFSGDVEESLSKYVRFKVLERPYVPTSPMGPNRPLFLSIVLVGGVVAGLAMGIFLKRELGLPVLGVVSMVDQGPVQSLFLSKTLFFIFLFCLFGVYLVVFTFSKNF